MTGPTPRSVVADLETILRDFPGREFFGTIERGTRFFDDLGMVSIDAVLLAEKLEAWYGYRFPFHELLAELRERGAEDIEVGDLADFIHRHLVQRDAEG